MYGAYLCRLSHHAGALPTPSPTQSRGGQHNSSPSPGKGMETNLHLSVPELVPSPLVHEVQEPRNSSPVIATVASPRVPSQKSDTEPRSHRTASARPRSKKRPSLAELDPMVPAVSHVDSQSSQAQGVLGSADAVPEDTGSAQGAAVPALDLNSITEERSKRNATKNKRSYVLEAEASGVGTTVEIDAISPVPGLPHTVSHANRGDSILEPTPQMPLDASEMMGVSGLEGGAAGLAQHGGPPEQAPGPLAAAGSGTRKLSDADVDAHVPVSVYEDAADTRGMTAIMDDQTTLMKGRGAALRGNGTLTGVQERDGSIADTGSLPVAGASESLPPGAIVRGRDEFLDQLKSKPGEVTGSIASGRVIHQDTTGIFASPWESSEQSPQAGIRGGTYVPSDMTSVMSGGSGMSTWTLSSHAQQRSVRRSAFSTMPSTSRSGRWSSRASHIAPSSSGHSNWTLSGEKSNWNVSAGDKSNFTMGGDQSNWTLSGNTAAFSTSHRVATRAIDDGRSEAFTMGFTEGASEWGLSPRGTARDDLDVGHSKRALCCPHWHSMTLCRLCSDISMHPRHSARAGWLQNDEIVMPSRLTARVDDQSPHAGLRQKYEHRKLRQQYAADDTTVPETALRRVDECASHALHLDFSSGCVPHVLPESTHCFTQCCSRIVHNHVAAHVVCICMQRCHYKFEMCLRHQSLTSYAGGWVICLARGMKL